MAAEEDPLDVDYIIEKLIAYKKTQKQVQRQNFKNENFISSFRCLFLNHK